MSIKITNRFLIKTNAFKLKIKKNKILKNKIIEKDIIMPFFISVYITIKNNIKTFHSRRETINPQTILTFFLFFVYETIF